MGCPQNCRQNVTAVLGYTGCNISIFFPGKNPKRKPKTICFCRAAWESGTILYYNICTAAFQLFSWQNDKKAGNVSRETFPVEREKTYTFLGMRIVNKIASAVSSRPYCASTPAERIIERPRSKVFKKRRTSFKMKVGRRLTVRFV